VSEAGGKVTVRLVVWSVGEGRALAAADLDGNAGAADLASSALVGLKSALGLGLPAARPAAIPDRSIMVAVLPFEDLYEAKPLGAAGGAFGQAVAEHLARIPGVTVVPAEETAAAASGLGDYVKESAASQAARGLGAQYAVIGTYCPARAAGWGYAPWRPRPARWRRRRSARRPRWTSRQWPSRPLSDWRGVSPCR